MYGGCQTILLWNNKNNLMEFLVDVIGLKQCYAYIYYDIEEQVTKYTYVTTNIFLSYN
jgi:hypothetical protein